MPPDNTASLLDKKVFLAVVVPINFTADPPSPPTIGRFPCDSTVVPSPPLNCTLPKRSTVPLGSITALPPFPPILKSVIAPELLESIISPPFPPNTVKLVEISGHLSTIRIPDSPRLIPGPPFPTVILLGLLTSHS